MKYVKYTSVGMSLSGKAGKVSYLHTACHDAMNMTTAGPEGEEIEGTPPPGVNCVWCGQPIESDALPNLPFIGNRAKDTARG